ncbi:haloacid dehalogenase [Paenibacillus sp. J45TS6]|uniref:HAD family hydrolase n=1 Tax=Paenibacillus sp. J45TS6 TaxID=2807196 RepID=UPI001B064219|nr:HAD family hydrolase [Paenibacillus sp. J45TS6]GIP44546.1 haloacid dehalogenase [Paenibacillus sp. J45TS6]
MGMWSDVKWLFFDVGDTLVDEWIPVDHIMNQFVERAADRGYSITIQDVREKFIESYSNFIDSPMQYAISQLIEKEEDRAYIRPRLKFRKELETPYPEAKKILAQLGEHYRIGIIANQSPGTAERLHQYGFSSYVDVIACSAEQGLAKPDVRLYEYALQKAGCAPSEAVMIGDRIDNDIVPAKLLGMKTIRILQGYGRYQPSTGAGDTPDCTISSLDELIALLL